MNLKERNYELYKIVYSEFFFQNFFLNQIFIIFLLRVQKV